MSACQLAQFNIAHMRAPADSPQLADFIANLDRINALADGAAAFTFKQPFAPPGQSPRMEIDAQE